MMMIIITIIERTKRTTKSIRYDNEHYLRHILQIVHTPKTRLQPMHAVFACIHSKILYRRGSSVQSTTTNYVSLPIMEDIRCSGYLALVFADSALKWKPSIRSPISHLTSCVCVTSKTMETGNANKMYLKTISIPCSRSTLFLQIPGMSGAIMVRKIKILHASQHLLLNCVSYC